MKQAEDTQNQTCIDGPGLTSAMKPVINMSQSNATAATSFDLPRELHRQIAVIMHVVLKHQVKYLIGYTRQSPDGDERTGDHRRAMVAELPNPNKQVARGSSAASAAVCIVAGDVCLRNRGDSTHQEGHHPCDTQLDDSGRFLIGSRNASSRGISIVAQNGSGDCIERNPPENHSCESCERA